MRTLWLLALVQWATFGQKAIFYIPTLSYSHVAFNLHLVELLTQNGFDVTVLVIDIDPNVWYHPVENSTVIHVDLSLEKDRLLKALWQNPGPYEDASPLNPRIFLKFLKISGILVDTCKELFTKVDLIHSLHSQKFDVGFVEQYDACGLGLLQRIEVNSVVWLSATAIYRLQPERIGVNYPLSYVPELFSPFSDRMTFIERTVNTLIATVTELTHKFYSIDFENHIIRSKSDDHQLRLSLLNYASNVEAVLANTAFPFDFPAPVSNIIGGIAGITVPKVNSGKELTKEWLDLAENSTSGLVLLTFGSITKTSEMPDHIWRSFANAVRQFPAVNFIVKYENVSGTFEKDANITNLYFTSWIPQAELMRHRKYRGVITHGGWSTILESVSSGQPMILMPLFADHFKNARVIAEKGMAVLVDKMSVHDQTFFAALHAILHDPRYAANCRRYARLLVEAVVPTRERVLDSVRRSLRRHRRAHWRKALRPRQAQLSPLQLYYLDIAAVGLFLGLLFLRLIARLGQFLAKVGE